MNFESYTGIPTDLSQCIDVDDMSEDEIMKIIFSNDCEGFALIEATSMFETSKFQRWVSFPYVRHRYALNHKVYSDIQIRYLMISKSKCELNLDSFKDTPKRTFHKVLGKLVNSTVNHSFTTIDPIVGKYYGGQNIYSDLYLCNNWTEKINDYLYYPHITAYIQQYTEIEIEQMYFQLMQQNIPVYRVWVDGIVVPKNIKIEPHKNWHIKEAKPIKWLCPCMYKEAANPTKYSNSFNPLITGIDELRTNKFCIMGEAGTGKTYNIRKLYRQLNNCIILVPKHNIKRDYPDMNVQTIQSYVESRATGHEHIIIDEYAMITQETIDRIHNIDKRSIILGGDMGQLKCINGSPIDTKDYNLIILEKNYRQKDKTFLDKLRKSRETGDISWITNTISHTEAVRRNFIILSATHAEIDRINKIGDTVNPAPEILGVKKDTPVRFYQTSKLYEAGDIGRITKIDESGKKLHIHLERGEDIVIPVNSLHGSHSKKNIIAKKAYSITYHAVQGKTISQNIALNLVKLFDKNMKYVGVSRATDEGNIYILEV